MTDIWMGAGPVPEVLHRVLNLLAKGRARFGLPSLVPLSRLFYIVLNAMRFGEHRGGMFVRARGMAGGTPAVRSWHLLAEGDDGPYIPSMAVEAVVRKLVAGERPAPGARSGADALDLADYDTLFRGRSIFTGFRADPADALLYPALLGPAFAALPPRLRELHGIDTARRWRGEAEVRRGRGIFARAIAALIGFPKAAPRVPVTVTFTPENDAERWTRDFGGRRFSSLQSRGTGKDDALLVERFGIVSVSLALVVEDDRLMLVPRRWSLLGVPMPGFLLPAGTSFETERDGRFRFDVEVRVPLIGLIVGYRGALDPCA